MPEDSRQRWLAEQADRYRGEWTVLLDHDARIVHELGTVQGLFGNAAGASSIGRHITSFVSPDDLEFALARMGESLSAFDSEVQFRIRAGRPGGEFHVVDVLAVNRFNDPRLNGVILWINRVDGD